MSSCERKIYYLCVVNARYMANQDENRTYLAIDLKSFYASVECVERGLDPLSTNLVVADVSRTDKTICLAVSPSLKAYGISGRARLFEVRQRLKEVNLERRYAIGGERFSGSSTSDLELKRNPHLEIDFIAATPRMALYVEYSSRIYDIYMKYVAPEDVHVYSVDEVFIDATEYMRMYKMTARELAMAMVRDVLRQTGITATVGVGTNLYLSKVAMDIVAKHIPADEDGVRISELDEMSYRRLLWNHRPLTDFWRLGRGMAAKLVCYGIDTMGKIARCSLDNENLLYRLFGVNAELLIDHAWGWEPCTMKAIKDYRPEFNSFSSGQVLNQPYTYRKARVVIQEMADQASLNLVSRRLVTDQIVINVGYDTESLKAHDGMDEYTGDISTDYYGRKVPKHVHGAYRFSVPTSSSRQIVDAAVGLFDRIVDKRLFIRRLNITTNHVVPEYHPANKKHQSVQLELFAEEKQSVELRDAELKNREKERRIQETVISLKERFGRNSILRGLNFDEGATARERNLQIGGHKA